MRDGCEMIAIVQVTEKTVVVNVDTERKMQGTKVFNYWGVVKDLVYTSRLKSRE